MSIKAITEKYIGRILPVAGVIFFLMQFSTVQTFVAYAASSYPVVFSQNMDASKALLVLEQQTGWFVDNGWYNYGPLYYRVAYGVLRLVEPLSGMAEASGDTDLQDKARHIALLLTNILAVSAAALFLSGLVVPSWRLRFLAGAVLLWSLLRVSPLWSEWIFIAHPDMLLFLMVTVAAWATVKSAGESSGCRQMLHLMNAGVFWGLALLTKASALIYLSGAFVVLLLFSWHQWQTYGRLVVFTFLIATVYVLVGYPQSLNFKDTWSFFMLVGKSLSTPQINPLFWIRLLFSLVWLPFLAIIVIMMITIPRRPVSAAAALPVKYWLSGLFFMPGLAFAHMFSLRFQNAISYYIFPVVGSFLACSIPIVRWGINRIYIRLSPKQVGAFRWLALGTGILVMLKLSPISSSSTMRAFYNDYQYRQASEEVHRLLKGYQKTKQVVGDPYVPYEVKNTPYRAIIGNGWTREQLASYKDAQVFVTHRSYYQRYLPQEMNAWDASDNPGDLYARKHEFYVELSSKNSFMDASNRVWALKLRTPVGMEIWERQD